MKIIVYIASMFWAASCSTIGKAILEKPKVELQSVGVSELNAQGATVLFAVQVENPNPFALKVDTLKYDVELGGKNFTTGRIEEPAEVAANAKSVVKIPVPLKYSDVFTSLLDLVGKRTSPYRIKGEATFGLLTIPFDEKGELKFE